MGGQISHRVLGDFVARGGALSLWQIDNDRSDLEEAVVALGASAGPTKIDVLLLRDELLADLGIHWTRNPASTPYEPFNHRHCEVTDCSVTALVGLIEEMVPEDPKDLKVCRFHERDVLGLLAQRVGAGTLKLEDLQPRTARRLVDKYGVMGRARFPVCAPVTGTIASIAVAPQARVQADTEIAQIEVSP